MKAQLIEYKGHKIEIFKHRREWGYRLDGWERAGAWYTSEAVERDVKGYIDSGTVQFMVESKL